MGQEITFEYVMDRVRNPEVTSFTKAELEAIGYTWPPQNGWRQDLLRDLGELDEYKRKLEKAHPEVVKRRKANKERLKLERKRRRAEKKRHGKQAFDDSKQARAALLDHFQLYEYATNAGICQRIAREANIPMPGTKHEMSVLVRTYWRRLVNEGSLRSRPRTERADAFFKSTAWRELRYLALQQSNGQCSLCGARAADGVQLHVDHIKPRSLYPHLARDLNNLQVLCSDCNIGKSNFDETNWRQHWESI